MLRQAQLGAMVGSSRNHVQQRRVVIHGSRQSRAGNRCALSRRRTFMASVSPCSGNFLRMVSAFLMPFLYCLVCGQAGAAGEQG